METLVGRPVNLTASGQVSPGPGILVGVVINSHSSGTLKFWNQTTAAVPVLFNTITLAAGERWIPFFNADFSTALFLTIGGTADVTVIYKAV